MTPKQQVPSWPLWGYVTLVAVSGAALTAYWAGRTPWELALVMEMGLWFGLLVLAGSFPVPVAPKVKADLSAAGLFAAALLLEPGPAALVAAAATVTYTFLSRFWGDRYRYPWFKFPFNAGGAALYTGLASWAFHGLSAGTPMTPAVVPAAAIIYLLNSGSVSLVAGIQLRTNPIGIWWAGTKSIGLGDVALYCLGFLGAVAYRQNAWAIVALVVPLAVVYIAFLLLSKANTKLQDLQGELSTSAKLASVGAISLGMAHQVRNPLAILLGHLEALSESASRDPGQQHRIAVALDAGWRINEVVKNLTLLGQHKPITVEVRELLTEAYGIAHLGRPGTVRADWAYEDPSARVSGNPVLLREAFSNLFSNAMQAVSDEGAISTAVTQGGGMVSVRISDNGPGIPESVREHLFEPFWTTKAEGVGLGLFAAKHILVSLGGKIEIESELGKGTTVVVTLPAAIETEGATPIVASV